MTVELGQRHEDVVIYTVWISDCYDERRRGTRHTNDAVEETHGDDWQDRPERVPEQQVGVLKDAGNKVSYSPYVKRDGVCSLLTAPSTVDLEPPQDTDTHKVLIEEIDDPV